MEDKQGKRKEFAWGKVRGMLLPGDEGWFWQLGDI